MIFNRLVNQLTDVLPARESVCEKRCCDVRRKEKDKKTRKKYFHGKLIMDE